MRKFTQLNFGVEANNMIQKSSSRPKSRSAKSAQALEAFGRAAAKVMRARKGAAKKLGFGDLRALNKLPSLAGLSSLQELSLSGTLVGDLSGIVSCTSLKRIYLNNLPVKNLEPVAALQNVRELYLDGTLATDLVPLIKLSYLTTLTLKDSAITDASPIARLKNLERLDLRGTNISNYQFLSHLRNLKWLRVDRSKIRNLEPLRNLMGLARLSATETTISDLSPLVGLQKLEGLQIDKSMVSDLSPVATLIKLHRPHRRRPYPYYYYYGNESPWALVPDSSGLSFSGCPLTDPVLVEFSSLDDPGRTSATLTYLRRQQDLPPISKLQIENERTSTLSADPQPLNNIPSPFAFRLSTSGKIALDSNVADFPLLALPTSERDHANRLDVCRSLAEDLISELRAGKFQAREQYELGLEKYSSRLPSEVSDGNILLADAEARTLRSLFAAEADILSVGFAAKLKTFLEQHIGLRVFYPEIGNFYRDVQSGRIEEPLSLDAVQGFVDGVRKNSPTVFEPAVQDAIQVTAVPVPTPVRDDTTNLLSTEPNQPLPPKDPLGEVDPKKAWDFTFAGAANNLWKAFREGEKLHKALAGWQKAGNDLSPHVNTILDWLHRFMNSGSGTPPMPPTISV
jgi:Leucine-rich repeat (LRR) protein